MAVSTGAIYCAGIVIRTVLAILLGSHVVVFDREVLVIGDAAILYDQSGSMRGEAESLADRAVLELRNAGVFVETPPPIMGLGAKFDEPETTESLLNAVRKIRRDYPNVDSIYAISDFKVEDRDYWAADSAGYSELASLLQGGGVRLYLRSVRFSPTADLIMIALESGGGVLE